MQRPSSFWMKTYMTSLFTKPIFHYHEFNLGMDITCQTDSILNSLMISSALVNIGCTDISPLNSLSITLDQEGFLSTLQESPGFLSTLLVIFPADVQVVEFSDEGLWVWGFLKVEHGSFIYRTPLIRWTPVDPSHQMPFTDLVPDFYPQTFMAVLQRHLFRIYPLINTQGNSPALPSLSSLLNFNIVSSNTLGNWNCSLNYDFVISKCEYDFVISKDRCVHEICTWNKCSVLHLSQTLQSHLHIIQAYFIFTESGFPFSTYILSYSCCGTRWKAL